ncbi:MAG: S-adenosylmethionine:tRNA ribosyltransferase-isomerase, partial [Flavobacteriales bacterium]|nr:S-adenosylmethionine:tRNA ribosyltransferase-isomerase [Flavobacteriales bacterium]
EWHAFIGNAKRWKDGEELVLRGPLPPGVDALRARRTGPEQVAFRWEPAELTFAEVLRQVGHVPLPPYMQRPDEAADRERYNTVFARHDGSVAAPTASLHLTPELLAEVEAAGARTARLTLHVGAGTFLPVKSDRMAGHTMHREQVRVPLAVVEQLAAQPRYAPIVPVGTTALRTLESLYWHGVMLLQGRAGDTMDIGQWEPYAHAPEALPATEAALHAVLDNMRSTGAERLTGRTRLLIAPGYRFRLADALVTNFHQPQSTLLLLVAAFIGPDWRRVYDHALAGDYRFLSYGDGSLLWRDGSRAAAEARRP